MDFEMFKMTRKTRIWLGWLIVTAGAILAALIHLCTESMLMFVLSAIPAAILLSFFWRPINYRPFMKQKAQ